MSRTTRRTNRQLSAWLAILAMTLNALWPLLAQAKPAPEPNLHELCTAAGIQIVPADGDSPAHQPNLSPHCAFCSLGADRAAFAPSAKTGIAIARNDRASIAISADSPVPESLSRSSAQPRAPPSIL